MDPVKTGIYPYTCLIISNFSLFEKVLDDHHNRPDFIGTQSQHRHKRACGKMKSHQTAKDDAQALIADGTIRTQCSCQHGDRVTILKVCRNTVRKMRVRDVSSQGQ